MRCYLYAIKLGEGFAVFLPLFGWHTRRSCSASRDRNYKSQRLAINCSDWIHREDYLGKYIIILFFAVIVAGGVFLATWDIPAPVESVEKIISNDRFPR
ncbi:MAG: hypothetical protein CL573_06300 [Alphaproteobacteria bacterium]|nr:hypothetical protein [Alphaproteobacteria bacterium]HCP00804.1 hypothetical protein [Rhodospirillaceae bacterium]